MAKNKPAARRKPVARKKPAARKKRTPPNRPSRRKLPRKPPKTPPRHKHHKPRPPTKWLQDHPKIAAAIKWQFQPADPLNAYTPPAETDKVAWQNWSASQKTDLCDAYQDCVDWFSAGAHQVAMGAGGLTDMPTNIHGNVNDDNVTVMEVVTPAYMWKLYIAHVAFSLAAEIHHHLPWHITAYGSRARRYLVDSTTMAWNLFGTGYGTGTYAARVPGLRANNLPKTAFAPPKWTYPFLVQTGLIGNTRLDTIGRVLQWMRQNMWHFFGADNFGTCWAVWQYRGYPPLSCITEGTIDSNNPGQGRQHWTLGCHGSVGFLNAVLRVVNIPVQPVWICGHELANFIVEGKYLDHGDGPYNQTVKNSASPILDVLIDEATYKARFTTDLTINIDDPNSPACPNVGYSAQHFPP